MPGSHKLVPLKVLVSTSRNQYLYFPAEKKDHGKLVRQLIIFTESECIIGQDNGIEPSKFETIKCYIRDDLRIKDLVEKVKELMIHLDKDDDPKRKVNRVTIAWASEGWLFDDKGNRLSSSPSAPPGNSKDKLLPSSLPAPSEHSKANTDTSKNTKEKKKLFGNTLPPMSQPTNANSKRKEKKVGPFLMSDNESDADLSFDSERKSVQPKPTADSKAEKVEGEKKRAIQKNQPIRNEASNKARDGKSISNSSKPTEARKPKRGLSKVSDSDSDPDPKSLFIPERKSGHQKSAADDKTKNSTRNPLARKSFRSDEEDNSASLEPRPKSKPTGGKTIEPTKPVKKTTTNTDVAGDKSNRREGRERPKSERAGATGESSRGAARTRDDRSISPDRPSKKPEVQRPRGESPHASSRTKKGIAVRTGSSSRNTSTGKSRSSRPRSDKTLGDTGIYYESVDPYKKGKKTWIEEEIDTDEDTRTHWEKETAKLEKARKVWKKEHGTEL